MKKRKQKQDNNIIMDHLIFQTGDAPLDPAFGAFGTFLKDQIS